MSNVCTRRALAAVFGVWLLSMAGHAAAQERPVRWRRRSAPTAVPVTVFHSTQSANLPTAGTLKKGEWLVEISHRFLPPVSDGSDALWGFDGPVKNRLGLAYAIHDRALLGVLRSNLDDNLDVSLKVRLAEGGGPVPWMVAINGGVAWNTDATGHPNDTPVQGYGQLIVDVQPVAGLALGVVPSWLHNPIIDAPKADDAFSLGTHVQWYATKGFSFLGEWNFSEARGDLRHDAGTFGIELETGGHFFKIILTNSIRVNPAQFLAGTPFNFESGEWRVGFNITRLLSFG